MGNNTACFSGSKLEGDKIPLISAPLSNLPDLEDSIKGKEKHLIKIQAWFRSVVTRRRLFDEGYILRPLSLITGVKGPPNYTDHSDSDYDDLLDD